MRRPGVTDEHRFGEKCWYDETTGCIEWTAGTHRGYGAFLWKGTMRNAHRWAYEAHVGPIQAGLELDHLCRNRLCVNPVHLEAVTGRENVSRSPLHTRHQRIKTHCPYGHPYSGENLVVCAGTRYGVPAINRQCRTCKNASKQRSRQQKKLCVPTHEFVAESTSKEQTEKEV